MTEECTMDAIPRGKGRRYGAGTWIWLLYTRARAAHVRPRHQSSDRQPAHSSRDDAQRGGHNTRRQERTFRKPGRCEQLMKLIGNEETEKNEGQTIFFVFFVVKATPRFLFHVQFTSQIKQRVLFSLEQMFQKKVTENLFYTV